MSFFFLETLSFLSDNNSSLLHGPPGTGKTLTAEAVAEHLQRPLYMVGSSELSTNAPELESTLRRILRVRCLLMISSEHVF